MGESTLPASPANPAQLGQSGPGRPLASGVNTHVVLAIIAAGLALRVLMVILAQGTLIDDAYIALRYGRNLLLGRGMVYNVGERTLGAPPLYVVSLGMLWELCTRVMRDAGEHVGYFVSGFNILLFGLAAWLLSKQVRLRPVFLSLVPLIVFCLYLPFADNTTTGMETTLLVLLFLWSLRLMQGGRHWLASVVLGCGVLVRVEGLLWAASLLLAERIRGRQWTPGMFVPFGTIGLGGAALATWYYGTPIPHNASAKCGWIVGIWGSGGMLDHGWKVLKAFALIPYGEAPALRMFADVLIPSGMLLALGLFIAGTVKLWRERGQDLVWSLLFVLFVLFFTLGRGAIWPSWYAIPPGLALVIVAVHGAQHLLLSRPLKRWVDWEAAWLSRVLVPVISVTLVLGSFVVWSKIRLPYYGILRDSYGSTGEYLASVDRGKSLLVNEVGYIGYLADRHICEMAGIVSPEILAIRKEQFREVEVCDVVKRLAPDFVVLMGCQRRAIARGSSEAWFCESYSCVLEAHPYYTFRKRETQAGEFD